MRRDIIIAVLILLVGFGIGFGTKTIFTRPCPEQTSSVRIDTVKVPVTDGKTTALVGSVKVKPAPKAATPEKTTQEAPAEQLAPAPIQDTPVTINETGEVEIPITEKEYRTPLYYAVVRGFQPELKSLEIYQKSETIVKDKARRWALAVGPSATYTINGEFVPGVSATLGFVIWSK